MCMYTCMRHIWGHNSQYTIYYAIKMGNSMSEINCLKIKYGLYRVFMLSEVNTKVDHQLKISKLIYFKSCFIHQQNKQNLHILTLFQFVGSTSKSWSGSEQENNSSAMAARVVRQVSDLTAGLGMLQGTWTYLGKSYLFTWKSEEKETGRI